MTLRILVTAAGLMVCTATASLAAPVTFDFSYDDGSNSITGTIFGLDDDILSVQDASSVTATSGGVSLDLTALDLSSSINDFVVDSSGTLTSMRVDFFNDLTKDFFYGYLGYDGAGIEYAESGFFTNAGGFTEVFGSLLKPPIFTSSSTPVPVSAVPLPAGGLLLLSGLAGVIGLKRRRKNARIGHRSDNQL